MITEDYVSFEVAKLLKEKGFDIPCEYFYVDGKLVKSHGYDCNWNEGESLYTDYKNECSAPTLQMAMKWLREGKNVIIELHYQYWRDWYALVSSENPLGIIAKTTDSYSSYEEACEAGIKYCLENLI